MRYFHSTKRQSKGFTLIEMMVSVTIFTAVLAVSISSLLALVNANKKAQTLRVAIDNLDLVMEDMTRNIAQARTYHCDVNEGFLTDPRDCGTDSIPAASSIIVESNKAGIAYITYELKSGANGDYISKTVETGSGDDTTQMTNPNVITITNLDFRVYGAENDADNTQPRVMISVGGRAGKGEQATAFNVQTTVTQRVPK